MQGTYKISACMVGNEATDNDAAKMVELLRKRGYDRVEFTTGDGVNDTDDEDYIPECQWEECLGMINDLKMVIVIDKLGKPHGHEFGLVDVDYHYETENGARDGFTHDVIAIDFQGLAIKNDIDFNDPDSAKKMDGIIYEYVERELNEKK